jgi:hypothetical protein
MKGEIEGEVGFAPVGTVEVEMERKTQLATQVSTQVRTRPPVLPDGQREVLRETRLNLARNPDHTHRRLQRRRADVETKGTMKEKAGRQTPASLVIG